MESPSWSNPNSGHRPHSTGIQKGKGNYEKSPEKDEQLGQECFPIRHESQVQGLFQKTDENMLPYHDYM
jgi:hypothetical protein